MSDLPAKLRQMAAERRHASSDPAILRAAAEAIEEREEAARELHRVASHLGYDYTSQYEWLSETESTVEPESDG